MQTWNTVCKRAGPEDRFTAQTSIIIMNKANNGGNMADASGAPQAACAPATIPANAANQRVTTFLSGLASQPKTSQAAASTKYGQRKKALVALQAKKRQLQSRIRKYIRDLQTSKLIFQVKYAFGNISRNFSEIF